MTGGLTNATVGLKEQTKSIWHVNGGVLLWQRLISINHLLMVVMNALAGGIIIITISSISIIHPVTGIPGHTEEIYVYGREIYQNSISKNSFGYWSNKHFYSCAHIFTIHLSDIPLSTLDYKWKRMNTSSGMFFSVAVPFVNPRKEEGRKPRPIITQHEHTRM